ncbi:putative fatty acyl-CoA reductase CG5065 isoform X1 [Linepithema humile]|uniref:putative fatty acyl-CoA reductase CG5065 isoform X1 n=1 Tax=Linepithema humile TaxID=83485 RepID=UPI000623AEF2|nr:PREDICTED: putative fatty acyl-CoA reductase CG5065 [Linepithema humile]
MNCVESNKTESQTSIQRFYAGQSIFITGSTGFLGKTLVEKLLRSCPDISKIYLLIRSKKSKDPKIRLNELFESPLYNRLKEEVPHFRKKIVPITGDLEANGLGLSENEKDILIQKVSIVFHVAATVRFNENIKTSTASNVTASCELFNIIKCMTNLKSFIHVSTIYSQFHVRHIEERFYKCPIDYKSLIALTNTLSENELDKFIPKISSQWTNTYTFTKAIAEEFYRIESGNVPMGIFRPSIVISSVSEPAKGWVDTFYGPTRLTMFSMLGWLRFHYCNNEVRTNIIPVDITINALIASAWDVFNQQCRRGKNMLIYNSVSPNDMPKWGQYINYVHILCERYPCNNIIWLPHTIFVRQKIIYKICIWLAHLLPAFLVDMARVCMGRKPKMWTLYKKIHIACEAVAPFCLNENIISNDNVEAMWNNMSKDDQQLFKFDMKAFDWPTYLSDYYKGIRLYLLNEDDSTLKINRIKYKRLYWMHQILKTVLILGTLWILWNILANVFY